MPWTIFLADDLNSLEPIWFVEWNNEKAWRYRPNGMDLILIWPTSPTICHGIFPSQAVSLLVGIQHATGTLICWRTSCHENVVFLLFACSSAHSTSVLPVFVLWYSRKNCNCWGSAYVSLCFKQHKMWLWFFLRDISTHTVLYFVQIYFYWEVLNSFCFIGNFILYWVPILSASINL